MKVNRCCELIRASRRARARPLPVRSPTGAARARRWTRASCFAAQSGRLSASSTHPSTPRVLRAGTPRPAQVREVVFRRDVSLIPQSGYRCRTRHSEHGTNAAGRQQENDITAVRHGVRASAGCVLLLTVVHLRPQGLPSPRRHEQPLIVHRGVFALCTQAVGASPARLDTIRLVWRRLYDGRRNGASRCHRAVRR